MRTLLIFLCLLFLGCPKTPDDDDTAADDDTAVDDDTGDDDSAADDDDSVDDDTGDDDTAGEDADGDGFSVAVDCDDGDAQITPVWVSIAAPDGGDGSTQAPFNSILDGVAAGTGCVRVLGGVYPKGATLDTKVTVIGEGGSSAVRVDSTDRCFNVEAGGEATITGITLFGGAATEGGCLKIVDAQVTLEEVVFDHCSASGDGGAIYAENAQLTLADVQVVDCETSNGDGGGLYLDDSTLQADNCRFEGATAEFGYGGAAALRGSGWYRFTRTSFYNNMAGDGGGVDSFGDHTVELTGCLFDHNRAKSTGKGDISQGGALASSGSSVTLVNCTLVDNVAMRGGGVNYHTGDVNDMLTIHNSIFHYQQGSTIWLEGLLTVGACDILHSDFNVDYDSNFTLVNYSNDTAPFDPSNLFVDPMFVEFEAYPHVNDYHLDAGSPAIDAGDPDAASNDVDASPNDMGCYGGPLPLP